MGLWDLFKKKRKMVLVNSNLTIVFTNGIQLVLNDTNEKDLKEFNSIIGNPLFSDSDITEKYYQILTIRENDKPITGIKQVIEKKEEQKKQKQAEVEAVQEKLEANKEMQSKYPALIETGDFYEKEGSIYMNNIPLSIPTLFLTKFVNLARRLKENEERALDEMVALQNFWRWTSLCPSMDSRESMYKYIEANGLQVNKHGFFCAYRRVQSVGKDKYKTEDDYRIPDKELSEFISNSYLKVKAAKKGPKSFFVFKDDDTEEYFTNKGEEVSERSFHQAFIPIGNLQELYTKLSTPEENNEIKVQTYTDAHTHKMDIRIGKEVYIDPKQCDWNVHQECSRGLHISGNQDYGCGDTAIIVLVNPKNVVACPYADGNKMRVCAYYPLAVVSNEERGNIANNLDTLEIGEEYYQEQISKLNELVKNNSPKELIKHKLISNILTSEELSLLATKINDPMDVLKKRVIKQ